MNRLLALSVLLPIFLYGSLQAEVRSIQIEKREPVLEGRAFGESGTYEKLSGTITFEFDPANPLNHRIVDLQKAPRNQRGMVEAVSDFMVLRPEDPAKGSGVALLEVSNRGGKASLSYFNRAARGSNPVSPEQFGDGLLMRRGLTVIWVGWQHDVPRQPGRLRLRVPAATNGPDAIEGLVRSDWTVDRPSQVLHLGHRNHVAYPVLDPDHPDNVLTVRDGRLAPRRVVPRTQWRFARLEDGQVVEDRTRIHMPSGFQAGKIYELVYRAEDPRLAGLGLAALRDVISWAKHDPACPFPIRKGIAFGVSQTGRFLRHFLYQGFNTDEQWRQAFDGMLIHTAGAGRGSFNHRFAQPSRDAHRYSAFFYPTDIFPFSGPVQTDSETGLSDGLLAHFHNPKHIPKVFYTNTSYEYWGRAAALLHVTPDGSSDVAPHPNERIYHLAGGQHFVSRFPPSPQAKLSDAVAYRGNPLDFLITLRALLVQLQQWVRDGTEPVPSAYPRIDQGTLAAIDQIRFPHIAGLDFPKVIHEAYRMDYGPRWRDGIVDFQPPRRGSPFARLAPQVDAFGNDLGGLRSLELQVPVATYTPWSLRSGMAGGNDEIADFVGNYLPLAPTETEREKRRDPRPSLQGLYRDKSDFLSKVQEAARSLAARRLMLQEDIAKAVSRAEAQWDWATGSHPEER